MSTSQVMLVDASDISKKRLGKIIHSAGVSCLQASNSNEAIRLLKKHPVDLIFISNHLPGNEGLSATQMIKRSSEGKRVPTVVCVENLNPRYEKKVKSFGANAVMERNLTPNQVRKLLDQAAPIRRDPFPIPLENSKTKVQTAEMAKSESFVAANQDSLGFTVTKDQLSQVEQRMIRYTHKLKQQVDFLHRSLKNHREAQDQLVLMAMDRKLLGIQRKLEPDHLINLLRKSIDKNVNERASEIIGKRLLEYSQSSTVQTNRKLLRLQSDFEERFLAEQEQNRKVLYRATGIIALATSLTLLLIQYLPKLPI